MYLVKTLITIPHYLLGTFGARYKKQDSMTTSFDRKLSSMLTAKLNPVDRDDNYQQADDQAKQFDCKSYF